MAASTPTSAPVAAPPVPLTVSGPNPVPWWVPPWPVFLAAGLFSMTWWIMWTLAPAQGKDPSQLFNMLAQAIVLTAFIGGVVATVFTASRDSAKKNDTIAAQAQTIAAQTQPPQSGA